MEETTVETTTPEETVSDMDEEPETTEPESETVTEENETETSSEELETETESDPETETDEDAALSGEETETTTEELLIKDIEQIDAADAEAIVLAINEQTAEIQRGNVAICLALGLLVGAVFIHGFRLRRV